MAELPLHPLKYHSHSNLPAKEHQKRCIRCLHSSGSYLAEQQFGGVGIYGSAQRRSMVLKAPVCRGGFFLHEEHQFLVCS